MRPESAGCLADARLACERIQETIAEFDSSSFERSWQAQSIVERQLLILGESLVRLRSLEPPLFEQVPEADSIIRLRNLLVHIYDQIDPKRLFAIVQEEVPVLIDALDALLAKARLEGLT